MVLLKQAKWSAERRLRLVLLSCTHWPGPQSTKSTFNLQQRVITVGMCLQFNLVLFWGFFFCFFTISNNGINDLERKHKNEFQSLDKWIKFLNVTLKCVEMWNCQNVTYLLLHTPQGMHNKTRQTCHVLLVFVLHAVEMVWLVFSWV